VHLGAGFIEQPIAAAHPASPDQLLGLLAAGGQTAIYQFQIQALLRGQGVMPLLLPERSNHRPAPLAAAAITLLRAHAIHWLRRRQALALD
jgi:hypothetical protein